MQQLFAGRFAPITFECAYVRCPFGLFVGEFHSWRKEHAPQSVLSIVDGDLESALQAMEPITAPPSKDLLVGVGSEWTAIFNNSLLNGDSSSYASYLSRRLHADALSVCCIPDRKDQFDDGAFGLYRAYAVEVFEKGSPPNTAKRVLMSMNDGGRWDFINDGAPFDFEAVDHYSEKAVRHRVTSDDVAGFLRHFGLPLTSQDFTGPCVIVDNRRTGVLRSLSYVDARREAQIQLRSGGSTLTQSS